MIMKTMIVTTMITTTTPPLILMTITMMITMKTTTIIMIRVISIKVNDFHSAKITKFDYKIIMKLVQYRVLYKLSSHTKLVLWGFLLKKNM